MPAKNLVRRNEEGIYTHIYNRGVENRVIFNDEDDYVTFQGFLKDYLTAPQDPESTKQSFTVHGRVFRGTPHQPKNYFNKVELIAYSLMPNHFHLLLRQNTRGSLESFIRSLCTRYSIYFNKKYQRSGALFEGPYKSAQVEDEHRLLLLTRYVHLPQGYSSYAEYLGTRETSWVKPKVVQSFFDKAKTDHFKGADSYQDFVEKYELGQKDIELLEKIIFEGDIQHLERRQPPKDAENDLSDSNLKPLQRIPELAIITVVFLVLVTVGTRNIMVSATISPKPSALGVHTAVTTITPKPSAVKDISIIPTASVTPTTSAARAATLSPTPVIARDKKVKTMLTVTVDDSLPSAIVNIREMPTTDSEKVGEAINGDTYEFVSFDSGWYEVRLPEGSTGFISAKYIKKGGTNN